MSQARSSKFLSVGFGAIFILFSIESFAWTAQGDATITRIVSWESVDRMQFQRSDGVWCYAPASDKINQTLILSLYLAGKSAEIYCYDAEEFQNSGMPPAHKLHRIQAQ